MLGTFAVVSFIGISIRGGGGWAAGSTFRGTAEPVFFSRHIAAPSIVKVPDPDSVWHFFTVFVLLCYIVPTSSANRIE